MTVMKDSVIQERAKPHSDSSQRYYPRLIGMGPQVMGKPSDHWYELLVTGRDEIGGLAKLSKILFGNRINVGPAGGYQLLTTDTFVWTTFIEPTSSKSLSEALAKIRSLDFVTKAEAIEVKGGAEGNYLLDMFLFPLIIYGERRGIIMDGQALKEEENRLTNLLGSAGEVLMFEQGKAYATGSIKGLPETITGSSPAEFLNYVTDWLRELGWGMVTYDTTRFYEDGTVGVTLRDPPYSAGGGERESSFVRGVLVGIVELVLNRKMTVALHEYDGPSRILRLELRDPGRGGSPRP